MQSPNNQSLQQQNNRYQQLQKLGEGSFGLVYQALDQQTQQIVAIKKIPVQSEQEGIPASAVREITLIQQINHQNVVKLLNVIYSETKLELIFEFCETDLRKYLDRFFQSGYQMLEINLIKNLIYQILKGVEALHTQKIIHRDLKPQNILINKQGQIKIADFGLARSSGIPISHLKHEVVTLNYRPPDILLGSNLYDTAIDVWSIGCIIMEIYNLKPLFTGKDEMDQLNRIFFLTGTPDENIWPGIKKLQYWKQAQQFEKYKGFSLKEFCPNMDDQALDLVSKMLKCNPRERISVKDALNHDYFKEIQLQNNNNNNGQQQVNK